MKMQTLRMTNAQLIARLRTVANLESFATPPDEKRLDGAGVRDLTRLYRDTWLAPLLDLVEQRLTRGPGPRHEKKPAPKRGPQV